MFKDIKINVDVQMLMGKCHSSKTVSSSSIFFKIIKDLIYDG